ncbi:heme-degrading domain-containing protein [Cellulomonas xiejunii]|uniref:Heme-binding protein n=1 Tax=Cellulomonas xiejunii TaxID=2968083 RepID=A0ABY5KKH9_9CELL|nr:heme-binding protein [Cellulomonas xiejunii]MCC2315529.1 heme-binding protein [Cellulomonas xiejunii]MCC2320693.1 heme-binding protein [Cellulomonas xiejunii]UUI70981.1 heme-binding protein [Cellulomonas xiejunii]
MSEPPTFTVADLEAEPRLDLPAFTQDDAVDLGLLAVAVARERGANLAVRVELSGQTVFVAMTGSTGEGNVPWLEGKARVAHRFGEPSLLVRRRHEAAGTPFEQRADVDHDLLRAHGGAVPLRVDGEVVGTLTTSGEPDVVDHAVAAEAVRRYLATRTG